MPRKRKPLYACVDQDTATIKLMDEFESVAEDGLKKYNKIILTNAEYIKLSDIDNYKTFLIAHLVVERMFKQKTVGCITWTAYKQGEVDELYDYIRSEIDDSIITEYVGRRKIFHFTKPFLLRAKRTSRSKSFKITNWANLEEYYPMWLDCYIFSGIVLEKTESYHEIQYADGSTVSWS